MSRVNIEISLEGEDAMKVLRALLLKGQSTSTAVEQQETITQDVVEDVPVEVTNPREGQGARFKTPAWTAEELEYLALMQKDYYAEHGLISFRKVDFPALEAELFNLAGTVRTGKSMTVRLSMMRKREDERFFPEGIENRRTVFDKPDKSRKKK